ncbi:MAG: pilus assembly protein PilM [bacterium]|nr:pilus assembly protein PilM [bacterium]
MSLGAGHLAKSAYLPIGVDLGSANVTLAQVRLADRASHDFRLVAAAAVKTPGFEEKISSGPSAQRSDRRRRIAEVQEMLSQDHFHGRKCILALPARECFVQPLSIPRECVENPPEIENAIKWELQDKCDMFFGHQIDVQETVVQYLLSGQEVYEDGLSKEEVIAFGVSREIVSQYLKMAHDAKIEIVGLNVETCAMLECFSRLLRRSADMERLYMFVDLGVTSTQVVISRGPVMTFARNLTATIGEAIEANDDPQEAPDDQDSDEAPAETAPDEQLAQVVFEAEAQQEPDCLSQLVAEINQCLDYYESVGGSRDIDRVVFTGGGAYNQGVCNELAVRLGLSGQVGNPLLGIKDVNLASLPQGTVEALGEQNKPGMLRCPDWAVALGLSVGASTGTAA